MNNLSKFNNEFANLAESAYAKRPNSFARGVYSDGHQFNFGENAADDKGHLTLGGENLSNRGVVFLQRDPTLHIVNDSSNNNDNSSTYQKGLLTDEKAGFNAYLVTDHAKFSETKQAYLAIRGSDAIEPKNANDWIANDANLALFNSYIPQARLATKAIKETVKQLRAQAPDAKLNITGHSLGTMVSAQAVGKFYHDDPKAFNTVGKVVLFDGPDVTESLRKMGLSASEIKAVGQKVTYYVNPFDMVSMLNRTPPQSEQFGHVHYIVPVDFTNTLDKKRSAHDFGEFQMDDHGNLLTASANFHPEMIEAGHDLSALIQRTLAKVKGVPANVLINFLMMGPSALMVDIPGGVKLYQDFRKAYADIITKAKRKALAWDLTHVDDMQALIRSASGSKKVLLRSELLQMVAQVAVLKSQKEAQAVKQHLADAHDEVVRALKQAKLTASALGTHLSPVEVDQILDQYQLAALWDASVQETTEKSAQHYQDQLAEFSAAVLSAGQNIDTTDQQGAKGFDNRLAAAK